MKIINIEERAYNMMMARFQTLAERVDQISKSRGDKSLKTWLENQEVCAILSISMRTLQTYRDNGTIAYSQIGHKIFYRIEDVEQLLKSA